MKYNRRTAQSIPFSIRRGPFTNGSRTTDPVSASSLVTRRTVRTSTSRSSATCFFFSPFTVCRVIISSLIAMGMCRRFPRDMMSVWVSCERRDPAAARATNLHQFHMCCVMPGCGAPIPSKHKQQFGALFSGKRSIELTTAVNWRFVAQVFWGHSVTI